MAILQLPYNLSALFNFNEPDTNEGAMESSDEDFFDLFDFLPENISNHLQCRLPSYHENHIFSMQYLRKVREGKRQALPQSLCLPSVPEVIL